MLDSNKNLFAEIIQASGAYARVLSACDKVSDARVKVLSACVKVSSACVKVLSAYDKILRACPASLRTPGTIRAFRRKLRMRGKRIRASFFNRSIKTKYTA